MRSPNALQECIYQTSHPQLSPYRGKVRDVYPLPNRQLAIVVTDRISAFDHIMKQAVPYKGQILNRLSTFSFRSIDDLLPTHLIEMPHPNVTIAKTCEPLPIEVVVRGYLTGHAWRVYRNGGRTLCGVSLPDGMVEHQAFPEPILTPATKAEEGHDEDISENEILERKIVKPEIWEQVRAYAFQLYARGQEIANKRGLILVDTKYEFGLWNDEITLIDEVHTADSSRYFYLDGYEERQSRGEPQKQLSKEFLREMLIDSGFQGREGETPPDLTDAFRWEVHERYAELYEQLTGTRFVPVATPDFDRTLEEILTPWLNR